MAFTTLALPEDLMPVGLYQNPKDLTLACQEAAFRNTLTPLLYGTWVKLASLEHLPANGFK